MVSNLVVENFGLAFVDGFGNDEGSTQNDEGAKAIQAEWVVEVSKDGFRLSSPSKAVKTVKQSRSRKGLVEKRMAELLTHYETQTEEEIVAEEDATLLDLEQTIADVPSKLVPMVLELIAKQDDVARVA